MSVDDAVETVTTIDVTEEFVDVMITDSITDVTVHDVVVEVGNGGASLSDDTPLADSGSGLSGTSGRASRSDHAHPLAVLALADGALVPPNTPSGTVIVRYSSGA